MARRSRPRRGGLPQRPGSATGVSNTQLMLQQAVQMQRAGQWQQAQLLYRNVLMVEPRNVMAMCGVAQAAGRLGSPADGVKLARQAVEAHPKNAECRATLARQLLMTGDVEEAISECDRAIELEPKKGDAYLTKSMCLERLNHLEEAVALIDQALRYAQNDTYPLTLKARYLARKKDYAQAQQTLERVVADPKLFPALARTTWNELGMVRDKLHDYDAAFEAFEQCGRITAQTSLAQKCDRQVRYRMIESLRSGFTPERLRMFSVEQVADSEKAPAFLVGFPRSGTTLTEQIMAAHPRIETSDERPFMNIVRGEWARLVGGSDDVGGMVDRLTEEHVRHLRKLYWDKVEGVFGTRYEDQVFVDKLPLNINNLGLINLVFPDAKVIVALRDPRDVCLSCFMQDFTLNNAMIHFLTLEDTARFYERVMDLYLHIRPMLTLRWIEIRYEDTVSDLESQARRILDHLGVEWTEDVLRFHERARDKYISTPSYTAVSEPVHKGAVKRWMNYERQIADVMPQLERFVREFGYDDD